MGAQARGLGVSAGRGPATEDGTTTAAQAMAAIPATEDGTTTAAQAMEELFENMATEFESIVRKYAPRIKQTYKSVKDPQLLDAAIDNVLARVIRALEWETGYYYFDVVSVYNISDWLERKLIPEVDE